MLECGHRSSKQFQNIFPASVNKHKAVYNRQSVLMIVTGKVATDTTLQSFLCTTGKLCL